MAPWVLSFANGMTILGFLFARVNRVLPGRYGATKGLTFGLIGWVFMGLIFFPLIGLGPFAVGAELGTEPAVLSLAMVLTYSVVLGTVYAHSTHGLLEFPNVANALTIGLPRIHSARRYVPTRNLRQSSPGLRSHPAISLQAPMSVEPSQNAALQRPNVLCELAAIDHP